MLAIPTDFPATGSTGYLAPSAERVRILRHNADGTLLLRRDLPGASGNITADAGDVFASAIAAAAPAENRIRAHSRCAAPMRQVVTTTAITGRGRFARRKQLLECGHHYTIKGHKACLEAKATTRRKCRECGE
ncbi:UNVERIFIED_ORG: hypothetical protein M2348_001092 [Sphingomonas sp. R1F5B]